MDPLHSVEEEGGDHDGHGHGSSDDGSETLTLETGKIARQADGDARRALNSLEAVLIHVTADPAGHPLPLSLESAENLLAKRLPGHDKSGESHYNIISALHKSLRGSDPDASLYWLARMLDGGCDPAYVARRIVRMASEDIGNADPRALTLCLEAWQVQERLGSPEGELAIAQAIVYLACAAKSNAVYTAYNAARADVEAGGSLDVPLHLRNAPTRLMKDMDHGADYRYAHDEAGGYAPGENYFPEPLQGRQYYHPVDRGLESKIREKFKYLRELDTMSPRQRYGKSGAGDNRDS